MAVPQAVVVVLDLPTEDIFEDDAVRGAEAVTAKCEATIFRSRNVVWLDELLN